MLENLEILSIVAKKVACCWCEAVEFVTLQCWGVWLCWLGRGLIVGRGWLSGPLQHYSLVSSRPVTKLYTPLKIHVTHFFYWHTILFCRRNGVAVCTANIDDVPWCVWHQTDDGTNLNSAHWAEPSPLFAHRARPTLLKCKNEYLVLALGGGTAVQAVVGSIV